MKIPNTKIAVTLFNLSKHCQTAKDFDASLEKVKNIGYEAVQVSGIGADISPAEVKELLEKHKLYCCAAHENLQNRLWGIPETIAGALME